MHRVLAGFADLIKCIKGGGKLHVHKARAIQEVINLAKADFRYIIPAVCTLFDAILCHLDDFIMVDVPEHIAQLSHYHRL